MLLWRCSYCTETDTNRDSHWVLYHFIRLVLSWCRYRSLFLFLKHRRVDMRCNDLQIISLRWLVKTVAVKFRSYCKLYCKYGIDRWPDNRVSAHNRLRVVL